MTTAKLTWSTAMGNVPSAARRASRRSDSLSPDLLAAVLIALVGGAGALAFELSVSAAPNAMPATVAPAQDIPVVPYFPAQYVNQAKEIVPPPPTF